jgi:hypothetical protein
MDIFIILDNEKNNPLTLKDGPLQIGPYFFLTKEDAQQALSKMKDRIALNRKYDIKKIDFPSFLYLVSFLNKNPKNPDAFSIYRKGENFKFDGGYLIPLTQEGCDFIQEKEETFLWETIMSTIQYPFFVQSYIKTLLQPQHFN